MKWRDGSNPVSSVKVNVCDVSPSSMNIDWKSTWGYHQTQSSLIRNSKDWDNHLVVNTIDDLLKTKEKHAKKDLLVWRERERVALSADFITPANHKILKQYHNTIITSTSWGRTVKIV